MVENEKRLESNTVLFRGQPQQLGIVRSAPFRNSDCTKDASPMCLSWSFCCSILCRDEVYGTSRPGLPMAGPIS